MTLRIPPPQSRHFDIFLPGFFFFTHLFLIGHMHTVGTMLPRLAVEHGPLPVPSQPVVVAAAECSSGAGGLGSTSVGFGGTVKSVC